MSKKLKLITERSYDFKIEEDAKSKNLYLMGIFSTAEKKNQNGRLYKREVLEREIKKLLDTSVKQKTCIGQIGHPEDSPETALEKAAILIEDLTWKNENVMGKARVLNTPSGKILKDLINDGVRIGVSSRGLGTVSESGYVNDDYTLLTYDIVASPSNQGSWVNGILENKEFTVYDEKDSDMPTEEEIKNALDERYKKIKRFLESFRK